MDIKKRELNKLVKAYNNIYDFNNYSYIKSLNIDDKKELLKSELENIFKENGFKLTLNKNSTRFLLKKL